MTKDALDIVLYGAAIFFFMGLGLGFDARHHAEAAAEWERLALGVRVSKREQASLQSRIMWAYRFFGAAFIALGLWAAAAARLHPAWLPERYRAVILDPASRFVCGLLFVAIGLILASFKVGELSRPSKLHKGFEDEEHQRVDWERRLASFSGWLVLACFIGLGAYLLSHRG